MESIVVGVDGSAAADAALQWAMSASSRHGATLVAVTAWSYLDQHHADGTDDFDPDYGEDDAREALRASLRRAAAVPGQVEERVVCDLPARALLEAGADADLLVVGSRGLGGFMGLLLGSVSERVLEHATRPVAVVRSEDTGAAGGAVVVGVDGSDTAGTALAWAAADARTRGVRLHVVHAWQVPYAGGSASGEIVSGSEDAARRVLDRALRDPALAGLDVEGHAPCAGAAEALLEVAGAASVLVVGSRGLGRFGRVVLGSTSRQLAHHAPCPIVVVPPVARAT